MRLDDAGALVAGGASGLGAATAQALVERGARVAVVDRDGERASELAADFDPDAYDHVAFFDRENEWVEMRLRARSAQVAWIAGAELTVELAPGEEIRTEISAKFTRERIEGELASAGFDVVRFFTDGMFGLTLARHG